MEEVGDLGIEPRSQYLQANASTIQAIESLCHISGTRITYVKKQYYVEPK